MLTCSVSLRSKCCFPKIKANLLKLKLLAERSAAHGAVRIKIFISLIDHRK